MKNVKAEYGETEIRVFLSGHIDSSNAPECEQEMLKLMEEHPDKPIRIDAADLNYISSAGLRVLLRVRKKQENLTIVNVSSEVYEILEMTGFTQMLDVQKAYRVVSVEGCEEIGRGANGTIYRIDKDNVVKVYNNPDALADIQHEREVARTALVLGIPTAISYDVVRVGDGYGSVFELLNARSFSKILSEEPEKIDWCVNEFVKLLKQIHETVVPEGELPDMRESAVDWAEFIREYLPREAGEKLVSMVRAIPRDDHMIHGDYHTKNVELTDEEVLLIDMDTLAVGHPVFELGYMYNAFLGFGEYDHNAIVDFMGFDWELSQEFWRKVLCAYLNTEDETVLRSVEEKAKILGYTRMIRRSIRRGGLDTSEKKAEIELWTKNLLELLDRNDTLIFER